MATRRSRWPKHRPIDATLLERMAHLARGFPGRTVSLERAAAAGPWQSDRIVLRIDGLAAEDMLDGCTQPETADAA